MSRKRQQQVVLTANSSEDIDNAIAESDKKLVVLDIHQGWCGPCTTMEPVFRKAYVELDNPETRLKIYAVEEAKLSDHQRTGLPITGGCKPLFVLYKNRVVIGKVQGVNAPELETFIYDNVPADTSEE